MFQKRIEQFLIPLFDVRDGELLQVAFYRDLKKKFVL